MGTALGEKIQPQLQQQQQIWIVEHQKMKSKNSRSASEALSVEELRCVLGEHEMGEYINPSLDERFFIESEFAKFKLRPGYFEMSRSLEKLQKMQERIEKSLDGNFAKHHVTLSSSQLDLEAISDQNLVTLTKICVARKIFAELKSQLTSDALAITYKQRTKQNMQSAVTLAQHLTESIHGSSFANLKKLQPPSRGQLSALNAPEILRDLRDVHSLDIPEITKQFPQLFSVSSINNFTYSKQDVLNQVIRSNWKVIHTNQPTRFEDVFATVFAQFLLERVGHIEQLDVIRDAHLNELIREATAVTTHESVVTAFRSATWCLSRLMNNYHSLSRWFVKFSVEAADNLTDWKQQILDCDVLPAEDQRSAFLAFVDAQKHAILAYRPQVWTIIEKRLQAYIAGAMTAIHALTLSEFNLFLVAASDFIGTGMQFANSQTLNLRQCIVGVVESYVASTVAATTKAIRASIASERWESEEEDVVYGLQSELFESIDEENARQVRERQRVDLAWILPSASPIVDIESYSPQTSRRGTIFDSPTLRKGLSSGAGGGGQQALRDTPSLLHASSISPSNSNNNDMLSSPLTSFGNLPQGGGGGAAGSRKSIRLLSCAISTPQRLDHLRLRFVDELFAKSIHKQCRASIAMIRIIIKWVQMITYLDGITAVPLATFTTILDSYVSTIVADSTTSCSFMTTANNLHLQIRSYVSGVCEKGIFEKLSKRVILEHMNMNNENLIETHEAKVDTIMDSFRLQKKYSNLRAFLSSSTSSCEDLPICEGSPLLSLPQMVTATESFLSVMLVIAKVIPFILTSSSGATSQKIAKEALTRQESAKMEIVDVCFSSKLPLLLRGFQVIEAIPSMNNKWETREVNKDFKASPFVTDINSVIPALLATLDDSNIGSARINAIHDALRESFFKEIVEAFAKIKTVTPQGRAQIIVDIMQITCDNEIAEKPAQQEYIEKYQQRLLSSVSSFEDLVAQLHASSIREEFPFRIIRSALISSEAGTSYNKKKRQEYQIALLKNYQIYLRDTLQA